MEKRRGALLGLIIVALVGLSGAAHADKATERKAVENFAAGRYDDALELFAQLYAETLNPVYLRNIGRCQQKLRHPDKAIDAFKDYLAKGKKISPDERAEINGYIKEMEALRDEQSKQAPPPPANPPPGSTPPPVQPLPPAGGDTSGAYPPGTYPPGTYPPGAYPGTAFPAGGPQPAGTLVAQPGPPPASESSPVYKKWWFWTIIGAVVAGGVVTALVLTSGTDRPDCSAPGVTGLVCR
ncbi:MAG TPA: tetratricopeptide repeat protein [Polyangia bacterium]|nr:tetratricopeptide repeat protein [Polyangia bacterium]